MKHYEEQLEQALARRGLRPNTRLAYQRVVRQLSKHYGGQHPATLGTKDIEAYFDYLRDTKNLAPKSLGVHQGALRFYYRTAIDRPKVMLPIIRQRSPRAVPTVLTPTEVKALLGALTSPKIRAVSMVMYGAGLRVSEACALQFGDVDGQRGVLHVREGKGGHSRYALLSKGLLGALREYYRQTTPPGPLLFPGQRKPGRPITREAIHWGLAQAATEAKLRKRVSPHSLRHSFATSLLESGVDLRTVQMLLGHRSIRSTVEYIHIAMGRFQQAKSPLDLLGFDDAGPRD